MFKALVATAALALVSAQDLQAVANQAAAAAAPALNQPLPIVENDNSLSLNVDNYEWTLTEYNNNYELSVTQLAENANNLAPTLAALLANVGTVANPDNTNAASNLLDAEAASLGVDLQNNNLPEAGAQVSENADAIVAAAQDGYNNGAAALAANQDGVTDQVNSQIQNAQTEGSVAGPVADGVNAAVANAGQLNDLAASQADNVPVDVNNTPAQLADIAAAQAGNPSTADAANSLGDLANQAVNAGVGAANDNLGGGLADTANNAADNAANVAATGIDAAANQLGANNVNSAQDAANLVGNQ